MQAIQLNPPQSAEQPEVITDQTTLHERFADCWSDESNLQGQAPLMIIQPRSWEEVSSYLSSSAADAHPVVIAGAQTGLVGGALAQANAALLRMSKLQSIAVLDGNDSSELRVRVGAGVSLSALQEFLLEQHPRFWLPVDPTETSASLGGIVAVGAAGARSYRYDSIRPWVSGLRVVLADGSWLFLHRGEHRVESGTLSLRKPDGSLSSYTMKTPLRIPKTKSALGYCYYEGMDAVDVFISSEGTLGVITDIELTLAAKPSSFLYVLQFFEDELQGIDFVGALDQHSSLEPIAIEFCDSFALRLIEKSSRRADSRAIQHISDRHHAAVYVEFALSSEEDFEVTLTDLMGVIAESGALEQDCIAGTESRDLRDMKVFRHAIPESINATIRARKQEHPTLHKLALDMAVPRESRREVFEKYREVFSAEGLEFSVFGHAGDAHFHVNILARDEQELLRAKQLYRELAVYIVSLGGSVAAEHGIGRLKRPLLELQRSQEELEECRRLRRFFDPQGRLSPGVLIE